VALKHGLGKGLDALIPQEDNESSLEYTGASAVLTPAAKGQNTETSGKGGETLLPLTALRANPDQPRKNFDEAELQELADSIKEHGIISPIIAEDAGDGVYIIVAGERRSRAAAIAGLAEVPVIIRNYSDEKRMAVALIENVQRSDLNPIEEAAAYKKLMDLTGCSQDEVAVKVGKNRSTVANALRLLRLPAAMRESLEKDELSPGHARAILSVDNAANREALFKEITGKGLSVRETEKRAADLNSAETAAGQKGTTPKNSAKRAPELGAMEEKFIGKLGTKVTIDGDLNKGTIRIDYYSMEDLDRLYDILGV
jgi:ParB family chromosome partitioning protein